MRIAAIDCGSNSFHLLIADAHGHDQISVIEDDKTLLYLGAEVASTGSLSSSSLLRAKRVIRHYKTLISRHNVDEVRCVATSAIRSAANGSEVIETLSKTLGYTIRVISGEEEAQTIFRAISAVSALPESRILACDMGGGSLELMAGQRYGLEYTISATLGASRVARELNVSDPLSEDDISSIRIKCREYFNEFTRRYPSNLFSNVVASSGTLTTIISMARALTDGYVSPPLSLTTATSQEMQEICEQIISLPTQQRRKLAGYDKDRDDFLPTAAVIAQEIFSLVSTDAPWMISPYALREGLVLLAADKVNEDTIADSRDIARTTIDELEKRMNILAPTLVSHGHTTERIALSLFDSLSNVHPLSRHDRTLLGYAARIHDIGETISHSKHDQHGAYILSSIALVGFSPEDATMIRGMIRWHRTREPKPKDRFVGQLSDELFIHAQWQSAILRIADGLDSGKAQAIDAIHVSVTPDMIFIRCDSHRDCELELYSARRKRGLLETIAHRDVVIEQSLHYQPEQD